MLNVINLLASFSFWFSLVIAFTSIYHWWRKPHPNFPPLIRGIPGLGVLPYFDKYPQKIFKKWSLKMKEPVISVRIGSTEAVVVNTYDAAVQIFSKQSVKSGGRPSIFVYDQVARDHGIVFKHYDDSYKTMKTFGLRFMKKGFGEKSSGVTAGMDLIVNTEVDHLINELKKVSDKPINIKVYIYQCTLNVISKVVASKHYAYDDPTMKKLFEKIAYLISESEDAARIAHLNLFPNLRFLPSYRRVNNKAKNYMEQICSGYIQSIVDEHRANFDSEKVNDFIDEFLLAQQQQKDYFTDEELINSVRDFYMAGTDTVACSVAWALLHYLHHPQHGQKIDEEVKRVLGSNIAPNFDLQKEMPFTAAFLLEVMRVRTTVIMIFRKSTENFIYGKYTIPKGTMILCNLLGIHRDPDTWPDPEKFDPYRHIDDQGDFVTSNKIIPYGLGYRVCLGERLARREIFITFIRLIQTFEISADIKSLPTLDYGYNNLIHSPLPFKVTLTRRRLNK